MFLKRLEIAGFKSFANRTVIEFHSGVTSVVGPNGCGKSNVSDSIKWVLGEQSAKSLRGGKMEDIIFNGTNDAEPVNFAEVSIVFDNERKKLPIDYDEVVITRRLYRDGVSEYLINKTNVRLKDIQSLLAGTGLGVGNYSVIEQGRIDRILNAKPEDRRQLFEEAAGITRFKAQKKEALRNLEATELNLSRVNDIIIELKRQISSLERQAKKAEAYKRDFEKLKKYDIFNARAERDRKLLEKNEIVLRLEEAQNGLEGAESELNALGSTIAEAREALQEVDRRYSEAKARHLVIENQIKSNAEKQDIFGRYIEESAQAIAKINEDLQQIQGRVEVMREDERALNENLEDIRREKEAGGAIHDEFTTRFNEMEAGVRVQEESLQEMSLRRGRINDEMAQSEKTAAQIAHVEETIGSQIQAVREEREIVKVRRGDAAAQLELYRRQELEGNEKERLNQESVSDAEEALKAADAEAVQLGQEHKRVAVEISSLDSKREVLRELREKQEGFSQGARAVLEECRVDEVLGAGLLGPLADRIRVEDGYEAAMEAALGEITQAIVCRTQKDIQSVSERVRQKNIEAVILLSADEQHYGVSGIVQSYMFEPGVRAMCEIATAEAEIKGVLNRILSRVYATEGIDKAMDLSAKYPSLIFVTREGDWVRGALVKVGMAAATSRGAFFGRESKIHQIEEDLKELVLTQESLKTQEHELVSRKKEIKARLDVFRAEEKSHQLGMADIRSKRQHLEQDLSEEEGKEKLLSERIEELGGKKEENISRKLANEALAADIAAQLREIAERLVEAEDVLGRRKEEKEAFLIEMTKVRSQWETVNERYDQAQSNASRVRQSLEQEYTSQEYKQKESATLSERISDTEGKLFTLQQAANEVSGERERLLERHNEMAEERCMAQERVQEVESRQEQIRQHHRERQEALHRCDLSCQQNDNSLERLKERISDHYQVDLELPQEDPEGGLWPEGMPSSDEMDRIREKLAKVGNVNLIAVEEYGDLKERFEFLNTQREDLLRAKEDIHKALLKINRTTRELFVETFTRIQAYFVDYYKLLFNGGNAEIVLLDEGDVLESGIEIVARPPGKKLQSINLLSGGEKALTAIALMFAVFKAKPSPFCVLDEIDAPLDDNNVQRFTNALHEFVKECQFIIITHNKRTMAVADILYGITMQRTGISNVVSVKFSQEQPRLDGSPTNKNRIAEVVEQT